MSGRIWPWVVVGVLGGGALLGLARAQRDERLLVAGYVVFGVCALTPVVGLLLRRTSR